MKSDYLLGIYPIQFTSGNVVKQCSRKVRLVMCTLGKIQLVKIKFATNNQSSSKFILAQIYPSDKFKGLLIALLKCLHKLPLNQEAISPLHKLRSPLAKTY